MSSFLILLLIAGIVAACIWLLLKIQRRRMLDTVERTAPLPALQEEALAKFHAADEAPAEPAEPAMEVLFPITLPSERAAVKVAADTGGAANLATQDNDNWLAQIKALRDARETDKALAMCRAWAPRYQAFQQAAIILRGQIRELLDQRLPVDALLLDLYHTAVLADVFRNTNPRKPSDPDTTLSALLAQDFPWQQIGYSQLKLLNKTDVRLLEQAWGPPAAHRHAEEVLGVPC